MVPDGSADSGVGSVGALPVPTSPVKTDGHLAEHVLLRDTEQEWFTPSLLQHGGPDGPAHEHRLTGKQSG